MTEKVSVKKSDDRQVLTAMQAELRLTDRLPIFEYAERDWWVATVNGIPAGYAAIRLNDEFAWLTVAAVRVPFRGRGIQKKLLTARLNYAKRMGVTNVYTYTMNGNHPSAINLIRKGFLPGTPPEEHGGEYFGSEDTLYWRREL